MRIFVATPASLRSRKGNRVTANRWAGILRLLGHRVRVVDALGNERPDMLVALHAEKSYASIQRFATRFPDRPLVVALTGTDLYDAIHRSEHAQHALQLADRLIILQPLGAQALPQDVRNKARTIYQSCVRPPGSRQPNRRYFDACVIAHLRAVKDPLRAAYAARLLPESSRIRVLHVGRALTPEHSQAAKAEASSNPRYKWLGQLPRWKTLRRLQRSRVLVLTSRNEGGANVVTEALALGVPVISSRIAGSVGLLGEDYPGYFNVEDTEELAELLARVESDTGLYGQLTDWCATRADLADPALEVANWQSLLAEFA